MKAEIMWAITGKYGLYCGTSFTRKAAIDAHCEAVGKLWKECRAKGDEAIRVTVTPLPKLREEQNVLARSEETPYGGMK